MENRFADMSNFLKQSRPAGAARLARGGGRSTAASSWARAAAGPWARQMAAADRALVVLIENKGVDLGIPEVVEKLLAALPGSSLIPDSAKGALVNGIREKLTKITDNLLES